MDEQKYAIRRLAGLPSSGLRVLAEKWKAHLVVSSIVTAILIIGVLVIFLVLPDDERDKAVRTIVDGLMWGGVFALITVGIVVVYKSTRIFNMAHGGILLFLTYLTWYLLAEDKVNLPLPVALVAVVGASIVLGLAMDVFLFRGLIGKGELTTFLITLVFGFSVIHGITVLVFEGKSQIMPEIFPGDTISVIGNYRLSWELLCAFLAATVMFLIFVVYFRFTKSGLAMRCVSEDNVISQSLGIRVKRIYSIAWVICCLSAALGGILLGTLTQVYSESGGMDGYSIMMALPIVVLGGLESIPGAFFGALIIGLTQHLLASYVNIYVPGFSDVSPYVLLLTVMLVRPHGLFGLKGIKRI